MKSHAAFVCIKPFSKGRLSTNPRLSLWQAGREGGLREVSSKVQLPRQRRYCCWGVCAWPGPGPGPGPWPPLSHRACGGSRQVGGWWGPGRGRCCVAGGEGGRAEVGGWYVWKQHLGQSGKKSTCLRGCVRWFCDPWPLSSLPPLPARGAIPGQPTATLPWRRRVRGRPCGRQPYTSAGTEKRRAPPLPVRGRGARPRCRPPRLPRTPPGEGPGRAGSAPAPRSPGRVGRGGAGVRAVRRGCDVLRAQPHSTRPARLEMLPRAAAAARGATATFADDVLRVFGANHSLSAGQLCALLQQQLGAEPALDAVLRLTHNQVPRWPPARWRREPGLSGCRFGSAAAAVVRARLETHVQEQGRRRGWAAPEFLKSQRRRVPSRWSRERRREGAKISWGAGPEFRAKVPVHWGERLVIGGQLPSISELLCAAVRGCPWD